MQLHRCRVLVCQLTWDITREMEESDLSQSAKAIARRMRDGIARLAVDNEGCDVQGVGMGVGGQYRLDEPEHELDHDELKSKLVTHFSVAMKKGEVVWPSRNGVSRLYSDRADDI